LKIDHKAMISLKQEKTLFRLYNVWSLWNCDKKTVFLGKRQGRRKTSI